MQAELVRASLYPHILSIRPILLSCQYFLFARLDDLPYLNAEFAHFIA